MEEMTVLIADSSREFCGALKEKLRQLGQFRVVGVASDGEDAIRMLEQLQPQMLILDLMLPKRDGLSVLKYSTTLEEAPVTVATTNFLSPFVSVAAGNLGVHYIMRKPCDVTAVADRMEELRLERREAEPQRLRFDRNSIERMVSETLCEIGIPAHIKGYKYLREAIITAMDNTEAVTAVTKVLYPHVAKVFKTSANRVERDIRHAIDLAWIRGDRDAFRLLLNIRRKPTNSELIATIADKLLLHIKQRKASGF